MKKMKKVIKSKKVSKKSAKKVTKKSAKKVTKSFRKVATHTEGVEAVKVGQVWRELEGTEARFVRVGEILLDGVIVSRHADVSTAAGDSNQVEKISYSKLRRGYVLVVEDGNLSTKPEEPVHGEPSEAPVSQPEGTPAEEPADAQAKADRDQVPTEA